MERTQDRARTLQQQGGRKHREWKAGCRVGAEDKGESDIRMELGPHWGGL